ncbi:MAG: hypothetical protein ABMA64_25170, partial [Myxococcota bacterium]
GTPPTGGPPTTVEPTPPPPGTDLPPPETPTDGDDPDPPRDEPTPENVAACQELTRQVRESDGNDEITCVPDGGGGCICLRGEEVVVTGPPEDPKEPPKSPVDEPLWISTLTHCATEPPPSQEKCNEVAGCKPGEIAARCGLRWDQAAGQCVTSAGSCVTPDEVPP